MPVKLLSRSDISEVSQSFHVQFLLSHAPKFYLNSIRKYFYTTSCDLFFFLALKIHYFFFKTYFIQYKSPGTKTKHINWKQYRILHSMHNLANNCIIKSQDSSLLTNGRKSWNYIQFKLFSILKVYKFV